MMTRPSYVPASCFQGRAIGGSDTRFVEHRNLIEQIDEHVLLAVMSAECQYRNGFYCFTRRSVLAREVGLPRSVLNASIRRLMSRGLVRTVWSDILGRHGLECVGRLS